MSPSPQDLVHVWEAPRHGTQTLLLLHGRGGNEHDLVPVAHVIAPGAGVLAPRGPEAQPPAGFAWFAHRAIGVPVPESFDARLAEVAAWLDATAPEFGITTPITALGFSNGGMMAGALVAARPDLVDSAILVASGYALPGDITALGGLRGRRILVCGGDEDPFHTLEMMRAGVDSYRAAGAEVDARVFPGVGHTITREQALDAAAWLAAANG
jgi:predicted esterase